MRVGWVVRRLLLSIFFKKIHWYGYCGKPVIWKGVKNIKLARRSRIFPGSRLEVYGEQGMISICSDVAIAQNFHCTAMGKLVIGQGTLITANVCVTDIDHSSDQAFVKPIDRAYEHAKTSIGENCFIGTGAVIQAGSVLGDFCIVGANSVVRGHFAPYSMIVGAPARTVRVFDLDKKLWVSPNEKREI